MYKFEGPQEYTHPDQLIRPAGKTERYSNTGNTYLHQKMHSFPWQYIIFKYYSNYDFNTLAKLKSWKTITNKESLDDSWKASESWKLVRKAEKEMYRKMNKDPKYDEEKLNENSTLPKNEKSYSYIQEKIEKLQSLPSVTPHGDIISRSKSSNQPR